MAEPLVPHFSDALVVFDFFGIAVFAVSGAILAAIVLTVLPEALRSVREYRMVIYAVLLIVLMITRPSGIMGTREVSLAWLREKLFRKKASA